MRSKFGLMATYLKDPQTPRSGKLETLINAWRQIKTVLRRFKTHQGRLKHLKLFQIAHYPRHACENLTQRVIRERLVFSLVESYYKKIDILKDYKEAQKMVLNLTKYDVVVVGAGNVALNCALAAHNEASQARVSMYGHGDCCEGAVSDFVLVARN